MKTLLIATAAVVSIHITAPRTQDRDDRLAALESRVDKIESTMMSRDHLMLLAAAWVFDRMDLAYLERSGEVQSAEVAKLRTQVHEVLREGSKLARGMQHLLERERIQLALRNYDAAVDLRDDVYHRIRIFREEEVGDGPHAAERRRRRDAWIAYFTEYMKETPDPEKVKELLKNREKR